MEPDPDDTTAKDLLAPRDRLDCLALAVLALTDWLLLQTQALAMRILTRHL